MEGSTRDPLPAHGSLERTFREFHVCASACCVVWPLPDRERGLRAWPDRSCRSAPCARCGAAGVVVRGHGPLLRGDGVFAFAHSRREQRLRAWSVRSCRSAPCARCGAAGVVVRGHGPLLRGMVFSRSRTADDRAIRDVGCPRERAFIRKIAGSDFTNAGSRCTGMCSGVSERGWPAARSAGAAIWKPRAARSAGCCNPQPSATTKERGNR